MTYTIVKVERDVMAYWKTATFTPQGGTPFKRRLTDDEKQKMGGEKIAYFFGVYENDIWTLMDSAPKQKW